jgi:uncharacterized protein (DUF983 family)
MPLQFGSLLEEERPLGEAMRRGWRQRCPQCGRGHIFRRYLKVNDRCPECGLELSAHRADDAPPYFTILIVGHIVVPLMLVLEQEAHPAEWVHMVLWLPLTLVMSLTLLPRIKGALIGLQWAKRMHGFGGHDD